jgi:hypothetical protein
MLIIAAGLTSAPARSENARDWARRPPFSLLACDPRRPSGNLYLPKEERPAPSCGSCEISGRLKGALGFDVEA